MFTKQRGGVNTVALPRLLGGGGEAGAGNGPGGGGGRGGPPLSIY
jgi:hypothetical protein